MYLLTDEIIQKLENQEELPAYIKDELIDFSGSAYSNFNRVVFDLAIQEDDIKIVKEIFDRVATYNGSFFTSETDNGILLGSKLAAYLGVAVNDTVVLMSQGYHGATAAGKYPVRGLLKFPSPKLDQRMAYLTLPMAQEFFSIGNRVTSIALDLNDSDDETVESVVSALNSKIDNKLITRNWKELNKAIVEQIQADNVSGLFMLGILYMIIGFGILGTIMMMTAERKREFGLMISIGMQRFKLSSIVIFETFFIAIIGIFIGTVAAAPIILYGYYNPMRLTGEMAAMIEDFGIEAIMPMAWFDTYVLNQAIIVFVMVAFVSIIPIYTIFKLNVIKAVRS